MALCQAETIFILSRRSSAASPDWQDGMMAFREKHRPAFALVEGNDQ